MTIQGAAEDNLANTHSIVLVGHPTITRITLWLGENVKKVDIIVEQLEKPAGAAEPSLLVQTYLSLEASEDIKNAVIQFRVIRDWAEQNRIDENSITLLRLNGAWQELPTTLIQTSDFYLYYEATSPGFSVFAVAGQSAGVPAPLGLYAVLSIVAVTGGVSAFYWFSTRPMKPFVSLAWLKRRVMGRKPRGAEVRGPEMAPTIRRLKHATKLRPAEEPAIEMLERPSKPRVQKGAKEDVRLLKRLKRKMGREK
ncbi:MAG: PGF-pre-PGF domain-containing protein [Hadesarchaea archaeon]|nr:PGF-pre-PGF domain-containing protein [Hadesarchaea archaeon]